jgi:hypothetical protein
VIVSMPVGVTVTGLLGGESPLVACVITVTVYAVPLVSPVIVQVVVRLVEQEVLPGDAVAV